MKDQNNSCVCPECGWILPEGRRHRNHCPNCLAGVHMEDSEGYDCGGILEPIGVWVRKNGEWAVIHRCMRCGVIHSNRTAADDNPMKLMALAMRPFGSPAVPYEAIKEMVASMEIY